MRFNFRYGGPVDFGVSAAGSRDKAALGCSRRFMIPAQTVEVNLPRALGGVT